MRDNHSNIVDKFIFIRLSNDVISSLNKYLIYSIIMDNLPKIGHDESLNISTEGLAHILNNFDPNCPERNFLWTVDYKVELPVRVKKVGPGSEKPYTFC